MGLKVAAASLHLSQPSFPHSPSSSQTFASAISSLSSNRRSFLSGDGALFCHYVERSALFLSAHQSSNLHRSQSSGSKKSRVRFIRKALSASSDSFSDDEFSKEIQELARRFQLSDDDNASSSRTDEPVLENGSFNSEAKFMENPKPFDPLEPPDFHERDEIAPSNIERRANRFDIPLSLRIIKQKKQWQKGFVEAGESAYCSVKKAFSSMVFIIQELHSYTLQMREILFYEDLQGILASVQYEMQASFVWLFQKVFSQTPTLMVYVMILLANYSVHSMSINAALAAAPPVQAYSVPTEEVSVVEDRNLSKPKFDSSIVRTLKLSSSSNGKENSVGGNNGGGGGKDKRIASGTDGEGRFDESKYHSTITPNESSSLLNPSTTSGDESVSREVSVEEETALWDSIVEEASQMKASLRDEALDQETVQRFVSPVDASIEADDRLDYFRTELLYQTALIQEPGNTLLLANYAQFLYLVARDFDRYFHFSFSFRYQFSCVLTVFRLVKNISTSCGQLD